MSRYGARFGMSVTFNGFAVLAGPPIAGAIIGQGGGYVMAALFASLVAITGAVGIGTAGFLTSGATAKFKGALTIKIKPKFET